MSGGPQTGRHPHRRYVAVLATVYALVWVALAIAPSDRADWLLENALVAVAVPALIWSWRRFPLSRLSYTLVFVFLCLHTLGAHYTYSEVPYDAWSRRLLGFSLNEALGFERNHFDRLVHFSYGLLMAYPARELFFRVADARGFWAYFLPLDLMLDLRTVRAVRMGGSGLVRRGPGRRLSRHPGRPVGRTEGHGTGRFGRADRHVDHAGRQPALAT